MSEDTFTALRKDFLSAMRVAARPLRAEGWEVRSSSVVTRGIDGHWGHIVFQFQRWMTPLRVDMYAGTLSPYLMRVINKLDPTKSPPAAFVAAHTQVLWQLMLSYDRAESAEPPRLGLPQPKGIEDVIQLGPANLPAWLDDAFEQLAPVVRSLCSDLAIRDWLLDNAGDTNTFQLREAALLTRHLGRNGELPAILDRAAAAKAASDRRWEKEMGVPVRNHDRSTRYPQDWSHAKFVHFLESAPL